VHPGARSAVAPDPGARLRGGFAPADGASGRRGAAGTASAGRAPDGASAGLRDRLAQAIARNDYLRGSRAGLRSLEDRKEWLHFCVTGPGLDLLVNFSLSDCTHRACRGDDLHARLIVLVREEGLGWDGDVESAQDGVEMRRGAIDVRFGESRLAFAGGAYELEFAMAERPIAARLRFEPLTFPGRAPNIPLPESPPLHWVVTPRLRTSGVVTVGGRRHDLDGTLSYHDHNWGRFVWGQNFSWRWAFALPDDAAVPWTLAFASLATRDRHHALSQGAFLWRGAQRCRTYRDHDVQIVADRVPLAARRVFKIPRVMALLAPEVPTDIPRRVELRAERGGEWLRYQFDPVDFGQVVIPSEREYAVTILNEVAGPCLVEGEVGGDRLSWTGRSVFEFLHA
jgi:hypothetical protein